MMAEEIPENLSQEFDVFAYNQRMDELRKVEFSRLRDKVYLDHAGCTLYSRTHLEAYHADLVNNVYSNPHSRHESSRYTAELVDGVRNRILRHFNTTADDYSLIFTAGATASLKLLAQSFLFKPGDNVDDTESRNSPVTDSAEEVEALRVLNGNHATHQFSQVFNGACGCLAYLDDNHTSVIGMREIARIKGASCVCIYSSQIHNNTTTSSTSRNSATSVRSHDSHNNLFVYPAISNFSGQKYPTDLKERLDLDALHTGRWFVCIDAAAYLSTSVWDLSTGNADYLVLSFYKMFGFPTGLGALLVKKSAESVLEKNYFGGGTVSGQIAHHDFVRLRKDFVERFEDGTLPFLDIVAVHHGFLSMEKLAVSFHDISLHTFQLAKDVHDFLTTTTHDNHPNKPVAVVYSTNFQHATHGGIVTFNLLRADGSYVGYSEVSKLAALYDLELRTGCFCNIGACQRWLDLSPDVIRQQHEAGHVCGDDLDLIDGSPTGAVRVSFGYMSTSGDVQKFIVFIRECFLTNHEVGYKQRLSQSEDRKERVLANRLLQINVYPIKSCGAYRPGRWYLTSRGLLYDRDWAVVTESGVCLSQKREPRLCLIRPVVDLERGMLVLTYKGKPDVTVPLDGTGTCHNGNIQATIVQSRVCGDRICAFDCGEEVADWLSDVIGRSGLRLVKYDHTRARRCKQAGENNAELSLANETQYLLLASATCRRFHELVKENLGLDVDFDNLLDRFRANFLVSSSVVGVEEQWRTVKLNGHCLEVLGQCQRCQVICLDQSTAERQAGIWTALRDWRRGSKFTFGVQLQNATQMYERREIRIGDEVGITVQLNA